MLSVANVDFAFGGKPVLTRVSLQCESGETVAIIGRSGHGKSTLLNLVSGILSCDSGHISIDGELPQVAAKRGWIGYVFQTPTLMPWLTVAQNVELALSVTDANHEPVSERLNRALRIGHIQHAADHLPSELSGGMQTRAAIARALSYGPRLVLADEPFSALDDIVKESLYQEFQEITAVTKMSTLLVTHSLTEALILADRVATLAPQGLGTGSTITLQESVTFERPRTSAVTTSQEFGRMRERLMEALR